MPPSHGFLLRDIHEDIEDHIKYDSAWESEDGETPDTPLNIRAIGIFNRLQDAGWFKTERWGMERTVVMRRHQPVSNVADRLRRNRPRLRFWEDPIN